MASRIRALDAAEPRRDEQSFGLNPLFSAFTAEFDDTFDRGVPMDLDFYVPRRGLGEGDAERETLEVLFAARGPKVYVLRGDVGSGKTSFSRYLCLRVLPEMGRSVVALYLDAWGMAHSRAKDTSPFKSLLVDGAKRALIEGGQARYANERDFFADVFETLGWAGLSDAELLDRSEQIDARRILQYFDKSPGITHVLIVVDNLDEDHAETIDAGRDFTAWVSRESEKWSSTRLSLLVPLREYTANKFPEGRRFAHRLLPPVDEAKVFAAKMRQASSTVLKAEPKTLEAEVTYMLPSGRDGRPTPQVRRVIVNTQNADMFLCQMASHVLSSKEPNLVELLRGVSAGNLKVLVANTYNLLHSCKLPLFPLFGKVFIPETAVDDRPDDSLISFGVGLECLMAIHYPFYDRESSLIVNVFNALDSTAPNDFRNTLAIPRLLAWLHNCGASTLGGVSAKFYSSYGREYVRAALEKCFKYGLLKSSHGASLDHLSATCDIRISTSGIFYLERLLREPSYLQYACEDTPMPSTYVVPIGDKYTGAGHSGSRERRLDGARRLVKFVEHEEDHERTALLERGTPDYDAYAIQVGLPEKGHGRMLLHSYLSSVALKRLEAIGDQGPG